jgi:hypothetical protein
MKGCARVLATISLLLFIVTATVALTLINVRLYLLSPETYSQALNLEGIYDELPTIAGDQLRYSLSLNPCLEDPEVCEGEGLSDIPEDGGAGPPGYFKNLPEQVWEGVITALIDASWVEDQIEDVLSQIFAFLVEETPSDAIVISLEGIKDRIDGEAAYQAIVNVMSAQPACTAEQIAALTHTFASDGLNGAMIQCNPPQEVMILVEPFVRLGLEDVVGMLPSHVGVEIPPELYTPGGSPATILSIARGVFGFAPWMALFWLLAVSVFAVRDLRSWLGWWGTGLFMLGICTLAIGLSLRPLMAWSLDRVILSRGVIGLSPILLNAALRVAALIMSKFSLRLLTQAGILLGLGMLMLIFRLITRTSSVGQIGAQLKEPRSNS